MCTSEFFSKPVHIGPRFRIDLGCLAHENGMIGIASVGQSPAKRGWDIAKAGQEWRGQQTQNQTGQQMVPKFHSGSFEN